jgi:hypothetical protein
MKYLLLLYDDPDATEAMTPAERRAIVDEHIAFARMLRERGVHVFSEPLSGPEEARTVRLDGAEAIVTDGPFVEAKESLGGFYVIDCPGIDDAVALAREVPRSPGLAVEIRPIPDV